MYIAAIACALAALGTQTTQDRLCIQPQAYKREQAPHLRATPSMEDDGAVWTLGQLMRRARRPPQTHNTASTRKVCHANTRPARLKVVCGSLQQAEENRLHAAAVSRMYKRLRTRHAPETLCWATAEARTSCSGPPQP